MMQTFPTYVENWRSAELELAVQELSGEHPRARVAVIRDVLKQVASQVAPNQGYESLMSTARLHLRQFSGPGGVVSPA